MSMNVNICNPFASLAFAACFLLPNAATARGSQPADAGVSVDRYLQANLRDPGSAQGYAVGDAHECRVGILGRKWCVCWQINAKNGMGGYNGPQRFVGWFDKRGDDLAGATEAVPMGLGAHCLRQDLEPRDASLIASP